MNVESAKERRSKALHDLWDAVEKIGKIKDGPQLSGNSVYHIQVLEATFKGTVISLWRYTRTKQKDGSNKLGETKVEIMYPEDSRLKVIYDLTKRIKEDNQL